jgi:lysophospholipase L1-like esterase
VSGRYVALGSSFAAGPGIEPGAADAPTMSGRSAANYAHLVAERMGYDLVDVTFSGATTASILTESQHGAPPQIEAIDGSEALVTITIGGNDAGYLMMLMAAGVPRWVRSTPFIGRAVRRQLDPKVRAAALAQVGESLRTVGAEVRRRAPNARVVFVDYLTVLPQPGVPAPPFSEADLETGRHIGATLEALTESAAADTGCELVRAGVASRDHHPWSADPWVTMYGWYLPGKVAPLHPNAEGMRAVADLVIAHLGEIDGRPAGVPERSG